MRRLLRPAWPWIAMLAVGTVVAALDWFLRESTTPRGLSWVALLLAAVGAAGLLMRRRLDPL